MTSGDPLVARARRLLTSVRTRFVVGLVLLVAIAIAVTMFITRQVLVARAGDRIDAELNQEAEELRILASGTDPVTGRPFGPDVRRIFEVFLSRQVPAPNETMVTLIDGRPFLRSSRPVPYRVDLDRQLVTTWAATTEPVRDRVATPAGAFDYLAVPVEAGERVLGVFVVGLFRDPSVAEIERTVRVAAQVAAVVLLFATGMAWSVADRVLAPVRVITRTARRIGESELTRRIPVRGHDELAELATTFNAMLDRLEDAFESQRAFIDDAGHELRTPITAIRGHLEVMGDDPDERRATVALVLDELDRMHRFVEDLLTLAKAEQPDFLRLDPVDLDVLTREVLEKAAGLAPRTWKLDAVGRGTIIADRQRLTQAMLQLAQNATQHTAPGGEIGVGSALVGSDAHLWVRDRGSGIPETERERIFARFRRGAGRRPSDGAGLGLSIVRAIAEAHGGDVRLESEVGEGSTFTLIVPVDPPADAARTSRREPA